MSVQVSLNLSKELGKSDEMQGWPSIYRNELVKFNYTEARMLDSFHYMTLKKFSIAF